MLPQVPLLVERFVEPSSTQYGLSTAVFSEDVHAALELGQRPEGRIFQ